MAVGLSGSLSMAPVAGARVSSAALGGRRELRDDLALIELSPESRCAAAFTRNRFCAAPVAVARRHLEASFPRYFLINAGNANAGTGERGLRDALRSCEIVARAAGVPATSVLPFSTGVIGEHLEIERFERAIPLALESLRPDRWEQAARAIMTTDTVAKGVSREFTVGDTKCRVNAIAKGSGMIRPDMATMLAFAVTDAAVGPGPLGTCLRDAVDESFNCITVDGDTSTNDACVLAATGASGASAIEDTGEEAYGALREAVRDALQWLAQAVVRDGEGATKFIRIDVEEGESEALCRGVAYAVAESPLVKTAMFASDPNWGRILAAVGRSLPAHADIERVQVWLDDVCIVDQGGRAPAYREEDGQRVMDREELCVRIRLGSGRHRARVWTSDLSHDYVRINAEYRS